MRTTRVCLWSLLLVLVSCSVGWAEDPPLRFWTGKFYDYSTRANDIPDGTLATSHNWVVFTQNTGAETTLGPVVSAIAHFPVSGVNPTPDPGTSYRWTREDLRPGAFRLFGLSVPPLEPGVALEFTASRSADKTTFSAPGYQRLTVTMAARRNFTFVRIGTPGPLDTWNIETDDYYAILVNGQATRRGSDGGLKQQVGLQVERYDLLGAATLAFTNGIEQGDTIDAELTFYVMPKRGVVQFMGFCRIMAELWHSAHVDTGTRAEISSTDPEGNTLDAVLTFDGPSSDVFVLEGVTKDATFEPPTGAIALPATLPVDILPGVFPNAVDWTAAGTVPVAILGSPGLPVSSIDAASIRFGAAGTEAVPVGACDATQDVSGDGLQDLVCSFDRGSTGLNPSSTVGALNATVAGTTIIVTGRDSLAPTVPPGAISGRVTDAHGPIIGARVIAIDRLTLAQAASTSVNDSAEFVLGNLRPGDYLIRAEPPVGTYLAFGYYPNATSVVAAGTVTVESGQTRSGIVVTLGAGTSISGTVGFDGPPPADPASIWRQLSVTVQNMTGSWSLEAVVPIDANGGTYVIPNLPPGTYSVGVPRNATGYEPQVYTSPQRFTSDLGQSTPVIVSVGAPAGGIDFALRPGPVTGTLKGRVAAMDDQNRGLSEVMVRLNRWDSGYGAASTLTDANGYWSMPNVVAGEYTVWFDPYPHNARNDEDYLFTQWKPGNEGMLSFQPSTAGQEIDLLPVPFLLPRGGGVRGTVNAAGSGSPLGDIDVHVYEMAGPMVIAARTDARGVFRVHGLAQRHYNVRTNVGSTPAGNGYLDQWWNGKNCTPNCGAVTGDPVAVFAGQVATASFNLAGQPVGGHIAGRITDAETGSGLAGAGVVVFPAGGGAPVASSTPIDSSGNYVVTGLAPGFYGVSTIAYHGYVNMLYRGVQCPGTICQGPLTPVEVRAGATTAGIDFPLSRSRSISGTVRADSDGGRLARIEMEAFTEGGQWVRTMTSQSDGTFAIVDLPAGRYRLLAYDPSGNYFSEWYDNAAQQGQATLIDLTSALTATADVSLATASSIAGLVTDNSSQPLRDIEVVAVDPSNTVVATTRTNTDGTFHLGGLRPGTYVLNTNNRYGWANEIWNNIPLSQVVATLGTKIPVGAGENVGNKHFQLDQGAILSGTVRDASGTPLSGIQVNLRDGTHQWRGGTRTNDSGEWVLSAPAGTFYIVAEVSDRATLQRLNLVDQLYTSDPVGGVNCLRGECTYPPAAAIVVEAGQVRTGLDLALESGRTMEGRVTDDHGGAPLAGIAMEMMTPDGVFVLQDTTPADGTYRVQGLPPGFYRLLAYDPTGTYVNEWFNDQLLRDQGMIIDLTGGNRQFFGNVGLSKGGRISGAVTEAGTGAGIRAQVWIYQNGARIADVQSDAMTGAYASPSLPPGTYTVRTMSNYGTPAYIDQWANAKSCTPNCESVTGDAVAIVEGQTTTLSFSLSRVPQGATIKGRIYNRASGDGVAGAWVVVFPAGGGGAVATSNTTNESGDYEITGLAAGSYQLATDHTGGFVGQLYQGIPCPNGHCLLPATPVSVAEGAQKFGVDFPLQSGVGWVVGVITAEAGGAAIGGVEVVLTNSNNGAVAWGTTRSDGTYIIPVVPGRYWVSTNNTLGYANKLYDDKTLVQPLTNGNALDIDGGQAKRADLRLAAGAILTGSVRASGAGVDRMQVQVYTLANQWVGGTATKESGVYTLSVPPGTYYVRAEPNGANGWLPQLYTSSPAGGVPCTNTPCASIPEEAKITVVAGDRKSGLDMALVVGAKLMGTVWVEDSNRNKMSPGLVEVELFQAGTSVRIVNTDSAGSYTLGPIAPGTFVVRALDKYPSSRFVGEYHDGKWTLSDADTITLNTGDQRAVDFTLAAPGSVAGIVFDDINDNGSRDEGEPTVSGVQVRAAQKGSVAQSYPKQVSSGSGGSYQLTGLLTGGTIPLVISTSASQGFLAASFEVSLKPGEALTGKDIPLKFGGPNVRAAGTVFDEQNRPLAAAQVCLTPDPSSQTAWKCTTADAQGRYVLGSNNQSLSPGSYYLRAASGNPRLPDYPTASDEWYPGMYRSEDAALLVFTSGETKTGLNLTLRKPGSIEGDVFEDWNNNGTRDQSEPAVTTTVSVWGEVAGAAVSYKQVTTDSAGHYAITGIPSRPNVPMMIRVNGSSRQLANVWYDGNHGTTQFALATRIVPPSGGVQTGVDFAMTIPAGVARVVGYVTRVTDGAVSVVPSVSVSLRNELGTVVAINTTGVSGLYTLKVPTTGRYWVYTTNAHTLAPPMDNQVYSGGVCPGSGCVFTPERLLTIDSGDLVIAGIQLSSNRPPSANAGLDQTVEATSAAGASVNLNGSDSSDPDGNTLAYSWSGSFGTASGVSPSVALPLGIHVITLTVDDGRGGTSTDTVSVEVRDTTPPAVTVPAPITAEATSAAGASVTFAASAADVVSGSPATTCVPASGSTFPLGATGVTCSATDGAGMTGSATFTVTVVDTTKPALVIPPPIEVDATSGGGTAVVFAVSAGDAVDPTPIVICMPASGSLFPTGTTQVTCTATDASGNTAGAAFSVTVRAPLSTDADVLTQIRALLDTTTEKEDQKKLEDAARHLQKALDSDAWIDPLHLDAKKGQEVFQEHKNTVNKLRDLLKDKKSGIPDATLTGWIDRLVTASRVLATTSIADSRTGDAKKLEKAAEELAKGDEAAAQDDWGKAIEHYRNAWKQALNAVR